MRDRPSLLVALRLYRLRTSGRPLSIPREALLLTFALYLAGLAAATLTFSRNARGNLMLFLPLGLLLPLVWRQLRFRRGIQIAIALSVGIEIGQYLSRALGSHRTVDINDVILNVVGASIGLAVVSLLRLRQGARPAVQRA